MKKLYFLLFLTLAAVTASAQERLLFSHSCNYDGEIPPDEALYGFASDDEAEDALKRIMRYTGLPANFAIMAANVPNAAAALYEGKRYILYNQYFMYRIKDQTKTDWAALSILAHEIGHHLSGHTLDDIGSRPGKELEADRFAGYVLYKMGAQLDEALIAIETLASDTGGATHPPKSARIAAMTNGWMDARQQGAGVQPILEDKGDMQARGVAPVVPETLEAGVFYKKIWVEPAAVGKIKGLRIHAHFEAQNLAGQECRVVVWFYDAATKEPLEDLNGRFATANGDVAIILDFTAHNAFVEYTDYPMFIPFDELHLDEGDHDIHFQMGIFQKLPEEKMQQVGPVSPFTAFSFRK